MPYVAPARATRESRLAAAAARWDRILGSMPELQAAVSLQRDLIGLMVDLMDILKRSGVPRLTLPPKYLAAKLNRGTPALQGEPVPIPDTVLTPTLLAVCDALARGGADQAALHIRSALTETRIEACSLLAASLKRDQAAIRTGAVHRGLAPDLLWLIAELAVSPFAHALQQSLVAPEPATSPFRVALDAWRHGFCPFCGSWPALAEVAATHRVLRCSFCALAWEPDMAACVYCGEGGAAFVTAAPKDHREEHRIEVCNSCRAYLKAIDVPALSPFPLVGIADLETMALDVAAMEQGYTRPPMKEFGKRHRP